MFMVSAEQVEDQTATRLEAFLHEIEAWSRATHGPAMAALPEGAVRSETLCARRNGFVQRGHVKRWLDLALTFGAPLTQVNWAAPIIADQALPPAGRLHLLEREATLIALEEDEAEQEALRDAV